MWWSPGERNKIRLVKNTLVRALPCRLQGQSADTIVTLESKALLLHLIDNGNMGPCSLYSQYTGKMKFLPWMEKEEEGDRIRTDYLGCFTIFRESKESGVGF